MNVPMPNGYRIHALWYDAFTEGRRGVRVAASKRLVTKANAFFGSIAYINGATPNVYLVPQADMPRATLCPPDSRKDERGPLNL